MLCKTCPKRNTCKEICEELEKILPKDYTGRLKGEFPLSNDLIDRDFAKENGSITSLKKLRDRRKRKLSSDR